MTRLRPLRAEAYNGERWASRLISAPTGHVDSAARRGAYGGIGMLLVLLSLGCARVTSPSSPSDPSLGGPSSSVGTAAPEAEDGLGTAALEKVADAAPEAEDGLGTAALKKVANTRVLFGHRSVGASIVELGIAAVYDQHGLDSPVVSEQSPEGSFRDEWLTQTENPLDKLKEFDAWFRSREMGEGVDVAAMKLGYLDVGADTDTKGLFDNYVTLMDDLERDYPAIRFLHSTITVTQWDPTALAAIERFNALMRSKYRASGRLADLAWVLSDCPGIGREAKFTEAGETYYTLCDSFSADGGHLSELGSTVAAEELLRVIALSTQG